MALNTGPFAIKFGTVEIQDVSELSWDFSSDSSNPTTIAGKTYDLPTTTSMSLDVTILGADIPTLSAIFPEAAVAADGVMSTGETTTDPAFDFKSATACGTVRLQDDLEVIGCDTTTRLVDATAKIASIDYEDNIVQTVTVTFTGQSPEGVAIFQMFKNGSLTPATPTP